MRDMELNLVVFAPVSCCLISFESWGNNPVQNEELFKILDYATPFFPFKTQVDIVVACCIIHNWVIQDGSDELIIQESNWSIQQHSTSSSGKASEHAFLVNFRQQIANQMWEDYQNYHER
jgi:hypothetical protein